MTLYKLFVTSVPSRNVDWLDGVGGCVGFLLSPHLCCCWGKGGCLLETFFWPHANGVAREVAVTAALTSLICCGGGWGWEREGEEKLFTSQRSIGGSKKKSLQQTRSLLMTMVSRCWKRERESIHYYEGRWLASLVRGKGRVGRILLRRQSVWRVQQPPQGGKGGGGGKEMPQRNAIAGGAGKKEEEEECLFCVNFRKTPFCPAV